MEGTPLLSFDDALLLVLFIYCAIALWFAWLIRPWVNRSFSEVLPELKPKHPDERDDHVP